MNPYESPRIVEDTKASLFIQILTSNHLYASVIGVNSLVAGIAMIYMGLQGKLLSTICLLAFSTISFIASVTLLTDRK